MVSKIEPETNAKAEHLQCLEAHIANCNSIVCIAWRNNEGIQADPHKFEHTYKTDCAWTATGNSYDYIIYSNNLTS